MKWVLFMTFFGFRVGASDATVEFNRQDDCERAAITWVSAHDPRMGVAKAWCAPKAAK